MTPSTPTDISSSRSEPAPPKRRRLALLALDVELSGEADDAALDDLLARVAQAFRQSAPRGLRVGDVTPLAVPDVSVPEFFAALQRLRDLA